MGQTPSLSVLDFWLFEILPLKNRFLDNKFYTVQESFKMAAIFFQRQFVNLLYCKWSQKKNQLIYGSGAFFMPRVSCHLGITEVVDLWLHELSWVPHAHPKMENTIQQMPTFFKSKMKKFQHKNIRNLEHCIPCIANAL